MRISELNPENFNEREKEIYDRIAGRRGKVRGPYLCWMHRPELCDIVEKLGAYLRWDSPISGKISELCICVTARFWDCAYSWAAHWQPAVELGVSPDAMDALARGEHPDFTNEDERVFYRFAMELLKDHLISDETYADAKRVFGEDGVVDLIGAIGNFSMLAMILNTHQVPLHLGRPEPFPDIIEYRRVTPQTT